VLTPDADLDLFERGLVERTCPLGFALHDHALGLALEPSLERAGHRDHLRAEVSARATADLDRVELAIDLAPLIVDLRRELEEPRLERARHAGHAGAVDGVVRDDLGIAGLRFGVDLLYASAHFLEECRPARTERRELRWPLLRHVPSLSFPQN
jgi:hypothetical protein